MSGEYAHRPLRSNFYSPNSIDYPRIKQRGWLDDGILVVKMDDAVLSWTDRMLLEQIGTKLYGARAKPFKEAP